MSSILEHSSNQVDSLEAQRYRLFWQLEHNLACGCTASYEEVESLGDDLIAELGELEDANGRGWRLVQSS